MQYLASFTFMLVLHFCCKQLYPILFELILPSFVILYAFPPLRSCFLNVPMFIHALSCILPPQSIVHDFCYISFSLHLYNLLILILFNLLFILGPPHFPFPKLLPPTPWVSRLWALCNFKNPVSKLVKWSFSPYSHSF